MTYTVQDGFPYYIQQTQTADFRELFRSKVTLDLLKSIPEEKATFRYAAGKWSIKQILGHITDHERIMVYRALRFSRQDKTLLPGYDQNVYVENSRFDEISYDLLLSDYENVRRATISFIDLLSDEQLALKGMAWKFELSVEDFLKATIGHEMHHIGVLKEKYLPNL
ncbi:MAG: DinB family protein [Cytophagaceae bacterium]